MLDISNADRALLIVPIMICLGACVIAAFWELEQVRIRRRNRQADRARALRLAALRGAVRDRPPR